MHRHNFFSGVKEDILKQKRATKFRMEMNDTTITDGSAYRQIINEFQGSDFVLTALLNTDGVNLYSSSKFEIWPIFLAINELIPKARFSRENLLLIGIWQGKGKPPFISYFKSISAQLILSLNTEGIQISIDSLNITVKMKVICGVFDLPAKASILNMMYFNGQYACITCEEPGHSVKQGKGTARCFPQQKWKYKLRSHSDVLENMQLETVKKNS